MDERGRKTALVGLVASGCLLVSTAFFARLPGRSIFAMRASASDLARAPEADHFRVGAIEWDVRSYTRDPHLAPLRDYFHAQCGQSTGLSAAVCLQDAFVVAFAHGSPHAELFDVAYDPVVDLQHHLAGEPGHCVTRSGLEAAILLSVGIPARVVQLLAANVGHTLVEVWDPRDGWILFDPTAGATLSYRQDRASPPILSGYSDDNQWRLLGSGHARGADDLAMITQAFARTNESIEVSLPEPWLYMRSGPRQAMWPFRAETVQVGALYPTQGPLQHLLRALILVFGMVSVVSLARLLLRRSVAARQRGPVSAAAWPPWSR